jgi:hypothetical protein
MKQHLYALKLLELVRKDPARVWTYGEAGEAIGLGPEHARYMGQVASRLGLAFFYAGKPLLTMVTVQAVGYGLRKVVFGRMFAQHRQEIEDAVATHTFTSADFDAVERALRALPKASAHCLWQAAETKYFKDPHFVRHNLHRTTAAAR